MADRSLVYRLKADITHYAAGMRMARGIMVDFADQATAADKKSATFRKGLDTFGRGAGKVGLVAAAGLGAAVVAAARFDKAMSAVQAATHETAENMAELRDAAIEAGQRTVFSATEAAKAVENLAKAGVSTKDILGGGLNGALDLAAAGSLDVAQAAEIAATAMTQFKLSGKDVPSIADALAAGAGKAQGEVTDLSQALAQVGLVANQSGQTLQETVGTLSAFASAGLLGSDSGTSLKTFMLQLVPATTAASKAMESYGLIAFDANEAAKTLAKDGIKAESNSIDDVTRAVGQYLVNQGLAKEGTAKLAKLTQEYMMKMGLLRSEFTKANGDFKSLSDIAGVLRDKLANLSQSDRQAALKRIFGQDAVRAATVLYDQGAQGIQNWTDKVDDSGYAAETARIKLGNLAGDLEQLRGSLETALIGMGEGAQGPLRGLTQALTTVVNAFNELPGSAKGSISGVLAATAVLGGGAFLGAKVIGAIGDTRRALRELGVEASTTKRLLSGVGKGFGAFLAVEVAGALDSFADDLTNARLKVDELTRSLEALSAGRVRGTLEETFGADLSGFADALEQIDRSGAFGKIDALFQSPIEHLPILDGAITSPFEDATENIQQVDKSLAAMVESGKVAQARDIFQTLTDAAVANGIALGDVKKNFDEYMLALENAKPRERDPNLDRTLLGPLAPGRGDRREDSPYLSGIGLNTSATRRATGATDDNTRANEKNTTSIKDQIQAMKDARDQRLAALNAQISYQQALDDANDTIKKNGRTTADGGKTLDLTTEKGRDNALALNDVAAGWNDLSKKMKNAPGAFKAAKDNFVDLAEKAGLSKDAAKKLANQILDLPSKKIHIDADTEPAKKKITALQRLIDNLHDKDITIRATTLGYHVNKDGHLGGTLLKATGGYISGPGTGTSDSIPAWLSNGEYVINAKATARHRQLLEQINANRYASGGYVGASVSMPSTMNLSPRDIAALAQAIGGPRQVYGDAHFYGDGAAEREARKRQQLGGF